MQGGGFAGTIQAYVPQSLLERYHSEIERVFGKGSCYILRLRGAGGSESDLKTKRICKILQMRFLLCFILLGKFRKPVSGRERTEPALSLLPGAADPKYTAPCPAPRGKKWNRSAMVS